MRLRRLSPTRMVDHSVLLAVGVALAPTGATHHMEEAPSPGRRQGMSDQVEVTAAREFGTDRPCLIGRIEEPNGRITLAFRYTDDDSEWFPSWLGRSGEEITQVPPGWSLSDEMVAALEARLSAAEPQTTGDNK